MATIKTSQNALKEPVEASNTPNTEQYFAVVYRVNGVIEVKPFESKERCLTELQKILKDEKIKQLVKATTIIKRDMSNFKDGYIFGCPKSLNVMENKNGKEK